MVTQIVSLASCHSTPVANVLGRCVRVCEWNVFWWAADWLARRNRGSITSRWLSSARVRSRRFWGEGGETHTDTHKYTTDTLKYTTKTTDGCGAREREREECDRNSYRVLWLNTIDLCGPAVLARAASEQVFYCEGHKRMILLIKRPCCPPEQHYCLKPEPLLRFNCCKF